MKKPIIEVSIEAYHPHSFDNVLVEEMKLLEVNLSEILTEMLKHIELDKRK